MSTSNQLVHADGAIPVESILNKSVTSSGLFSAETIAVVKATLKALYAPPNRPTIRSLGPLILPEQLILVASYDRFKLVQDESTDRVPALTLIANVAATSLACGSILAGQSSESDEFGDVGFWLGPGSYGIGKDRAILQDLGLEGTVSEEVYRLILLALALRLILGTDRGSQSRPGDMPTCYPLY
jgi:hypothetical protein